MKQTIRSNCLRSSNRLFREGRHISPFGENLDGEILSATFVVVLGQIAVGLLDSGIGVFATDPMAEKDASPTIKERLTKDTINGTLIGIDGEYYSIKDTDGKQHRIHVDTSTKLDKVLLGDVVKAYVTERGHTTTLQRAN
ncbi:MAG: hypothetical protein H8K03_21495 [Nitrospira sp.]